METTEEKNNIAQLIFGFLAHQGYPDATKELDFCQYLITELEYFLKEKNEALNAASSKELKYTESSIINAYWHSHDMTCSKEERNRCADYLIDAVSQGHDINSIINSWKKEPNAQELLSSLATKGETPDA